jgi:hypothetical protein
MYSLGNPEQNVKTADNLAEIPACCLLNLISRAQENSSRGAVAERQKGNRDQKLN